MEAALDAGRHVRTILSEALYRDYVPSKSGQLHQYLHRPVAVTDCKSLYDCLVKDGPQNSLSEKRLAVDIVGLQDVAAAVDEDNPQETFRWIPAHKQLADCMTKRIPAYKLREILERGWVSLVAEDGNDFTMKSENNSYVVAENGNDFATKSENNVYVVAEDRNDFVTKREKTTCTRSRRMGTTSRQAAITTRMTATDTEHPPGWLQPRLLEF